MKNGLNTKREACEDKAKTNSMSGWGVRTPLHSQSYSLAVKPAVSQRTQLTGMKKTEQRPYGINREAYLGEV